MVTLTAYSNGSHGIPEKHNRLIVLGNFDGVHKGHQSLIHFAKQHTLNHNLSLCLLTFEPHPVDYFSGKPSVFRLTKAEEKVDLLLKSGSDEVIVAHFDEQFSTLTAEDFVRSVLVDNLQAKAVIVGSDFRFGAQRAGDFALLQSLGAVCGFKAISAPLLSDKNEVISSTKVRHALAKGDLDRVKTLLGREWSWKSKVVHGAKRGRTLGIPTINQCLPASSTLKTGVYAVQVRYDGHIYSGASSWGRRPQFDNGPLVLETHILDFDGDLYDKTVEVHFRAFLRDEQTFDNIQAMMLAIEQDIAKVRAIMKA